MFLVLHIRRRVARNETMQLIFERREESRVDCEQLRAFESICPMEFAPGDALKQNVRFHNVLHRRTRHSRRSPISKPYTSSTTYDRQRLNQAEARLAKKKLVFSPPFLCVGRSAGRAGTTSPTGARRPSWRLRHRPR